MKKLPPILAGILLLSIPVLFAQEKFKPQFIVGVSFVPEWEKPSSGKAAYGREGTSFNPDFGLSFEARLIDFLGIETGLYYRKTESRMRMLGGVGEAEYYKQQYLSIPLLLKFYVPKLINLSVGATCDIRFKTEAEWDNPPEKTRWGFMFKVGKDIPIYKGLLVEPEFRINPVWGDGYRYTWIGASIGLKYRF